MKPKLLIIGASGLLGKSLVKCAFNYFDLIAGYNKELPSFWKSANINITDKESVKRVINRFNPNIIINSAAITDVDYCEINKKEAYNVNVIGTKNIIESIDGTDTKFVLISTDFVFDGKRGMYSEFDHPNPINYYGHTKLMAENISIRRQNTLIIRTARLYGISRNRNTFVEFVIEKLKNREKIKTVVDQTGSPTLVNDLAQIIIKLIKMNLSGIYNVVGSDVIDMHTFSIRIADIFGLDKNLILPTKSSLLSQIAKRPKNCGLNIDKIRKIGIVPLNTMEGLEQMHRML